MYVQMSILIYAHNMFNNIYHMIIIFGSSFLLYTLLLILSRPAFRNETKFPHYKGYYLWVVR